MRFGDELERVVRGARAAAENANHEVRVVGDELFHRLGSVIHDLEEQRPAGRGDTCQSAGDGVVDEMRQAGGVEPGRRVGVEDFQKMVKGLSLRLPAGSGDIRRARLGPRRGDC